MSVEKTWDEYRKNMRWSRPIRHPSPVSSWSKILCLVICTPNLISIVILTLKKMSVSLCFWDTPQGSHCNHKARFLGHWLLLLLHLCPYSCSTFFSYLIHPMNSGGYLTPYICPWKAPKSSLSRDTTALQLKGGLRLKLNRLETESSSSGSCIADYLSNFLIHS